MDAYIAQWIGARPKQEDAYAVRHFPTGSLAVLCDGMGGHDAGAAASRLAADAFADTFAEETELPLTTRLQEALDAANDAVGAYFRQHGGYGGTTLVAAYVGQGLLRWINGALCVNFGQKKGAKLVDLFVHEKGWLKWFVKGNFETDARMIVDDLLENGVLPPPPQMSASS